MGGVNQRTSFVRLPRRAIYSSRLLIQEWQARANLILENQKWAAQPSPEVWAARDSSFTVSNAVNSIFPLKCPQSGQTFTTRVPSVWNLRVRRVSPLKPTGSWGKNRARKPPRGSLRGQDGLFSKMGSFCFNKKKMDERLKQPQESFRIAMLWSLRHVCPHKMLAKASIKNRIWQTLKEDSNRLLHAAVQLANLAHSWHPA